MSFLDNVPYLGCGTRHMLQMCQGHYDNESAEDKEFLLFFQLWAHGQKSIYKQPKRLSKTRRGRDTFKLCKNPTFLKLRYTVTQCSNCEDFFSRFNTTKHWKSWESDSIPYILVGLFKEKNMLLCSDCLVLFESHYALEKK